jgi:purine-binding chemotaxis protein CheW
VCESSQSQFLVLESSGESYAVPIHKAREIAPIAELLAVPGGSRLLAGFLNLHGTAIPVIRIEPPNAKPVAPPGLHARILILVNGGCPLGILVDAVREIVDATEEAITERNSDYVFGACVTGTIESGRCKIPVLSTERLLLESEQRKIAEFQATAQSRMSDLDGDV